MKEFWNARYQEKTYAYGKNPNVYFKQTIDKLKPGKLLLPAEGEGRNAVYAARLGWEVYAYDFSENAHKKAMALAAENKVSFNYSLCSLEDLTYPEGFFDAIGLIYVHFPDPIRSQNHQQLAAMLKNNGTLILEGFSTEHPHYQKINPRVGGPKMPAQLYNTVKLRKDFVNFEFETLIEEEVELNEGQYHVGRTKVIRLLARKRL